jgi:hypothetical protein
VRDRDWLSISDILKIAISAIPNPLAIALTLAIGAIAGEIIGDIDD